MKIYSFLINNTLEGDKTISQVYCNNYFHAFDTVILLTGYDENDIEFMGYGTKGDAMEWGQNVTTT